MNSMKRVLAAVLMPVLMLTLMLGTFSVAASAASASDSLMIVDDDLAGTAAGKSVSVTVGGTKYTGTFGKNAFATVAAAVSAVAAGGSVYVAAGIYAEDLTLTGNVHLYGNCAGVSPNSDSDPFQSSGKRAITGPTETILQDTVIHYGDLKEGETGIIGTVTLDGFALTGDSCIRLQGERLTNSTIEIRNNIFELVNERAYTRIGVNDSIFAAIGVGVREDNAFLPNYSNILNNRILSVSATGTGIATTVGIYVANSDQTLIEGNYVSDTTGDTFTVTMLTTRTEISGNYFRNGSASRVYDSIKGTILVHGNTFDGVGGTTANGNYAFGLYSDATATNMYTSWSENVGNIHVFENEFVNLGKAIRLYAKVRSYDQAINSSPFGCETYNNSFIPADTGNCCFMHFSYGDGVYNPRVYDNYTAGLNPKAISQQDNNNAGAEIDFGTYWLNEAKTDDSSLLDVTAIENDGDALLSNTKINTAPDFSIATEVAAVDSVKPVITTRQGGYCELFADAACTTPLPNDTLDLDIGANFVYAKVHYAEYNIVYTVIVTKKVTYSTYMNSNECVVGPEFGKYATGQTIFVQVQGEWRRAVVGHSAYASLPEAIANSQKGDVVKVLAGVYDMSITVDKGLTIQGNKAGINPTDMSDPDFGKNPERSNEDEETIFTQQVTLKSGISGLEFDGIMLKGDGVFRYDFTGHTNGLAFKNILISNTASHGLIYKARNDAGTSILTGLYLYQNRYDGNTGGYLTCAGSIANSTFERNVYYKTKSNSGHYIGGTNGGVSSVIKFKDNIFYQCTGTTLIQSADGNETSNANARADSSFWYEGNRLIDCSSGTAAVFQRLKSGLHITIIGNRLEGTTVSTFKVYPQSQTSGQTVEMKENYFGPSIRTPLTSSVDTTADASRNYYAAGIENVAFGNTISYMPYYIDQEMTTLVGDAALESVTRPETAVLNKEERTVKYSCEAATDEVKFSFKTSEGATYQMYAESGCTTPLKDNTMELDGMYSVAYVKVVAADGVTSKVYTVSVEKPINSKAELKGVKEEGSIFVQQSATKATVRVPKTSVYADLTPIVSSGAGAYMYAADDTEMKNPILGTDVIHLPVGKTSFIIKVVSEDESLTNIYDLIAERREASDACKLIDVTGGEYAAEFDGNDVTVTYENDVTKVTPNVFVSDGASYKLYRDLGFNIELDGSIPLEVGDNVVYAQVTAEDGETKAGYTLHLMRESKSSENYIRYDSEYNSFPTFALNEAERTENEGIIEYVGLKEIRNFTLNEEYGLPFIYLYPDEYMDTLADELVVSKGATYDIFKKYEGGVLSGLVSSRNDPANIKLAEGENNFFIRVTAANDEARIYNLRVYNLVKHTGNALLTVDGFSVRREGNVFTCTGSLDDAPVVMRASEGADVKVYADRKRTIPVDATVAAKEDETLGEKYTGVNVAKVMSQHYVVYYVDVTSQAGVKAQYTVKILSGLFRATFADVGEKHWAADYITKAYNMGVASGSLNADGLFEFKPAANATRQEIAVFMCNLLGIDKSYYNAKSLTYKDSKKIASWAKKAVAAAGQLGFMQGSGGYFNPTANITRQEFMVVIVRACSMDTSVYGARVLKKFKDKNKIASWAKVYAQTAVGYGLISGSNNFIRPTDNITRAEIAKIMVDAAPFARG